MVFVGQLYACEWFPISGLQCIQFYICNMPCDLNRSFIQLERIHSDAQRNRKQIGFPHPNQPKQTIYYNAVTDSMDQMTFTKKQLSEDDLPDKHLRDDKLAGLFPYDGYEGPEITNENRCIGQMNWNIIPEMMYLYENSDGPYFFLYS